MDTPIELATADERRSGARKKAEILVLYVEGYDGIFRIEVCGEFALLPS